MNRLLLPCLSRREDSFPKIQTAAVPDAKNDPPHDLTTDMTRAGTKRAAQPSIEPKYSAISKPFRVKDRKDALSGIQ